MEFYLYLYDLKHSFGAKWFWKETRVQEFVSSNLSTRYSSWFTFHITFVVDLHQCLKIPNINKEGAHRLSAPFLQTHYWASVKVLYHVATKKIDLKLPEAIFKLEVASVFRLGNFSLLWHNLKVCLLVYLVFWQNVTLI